MVFLRHVHIVGKIGADSSGDLDPRRRPILLRIHCRGDVKIRCPPLSFHFPPGFYGT